MLDRISVPEFVSEVMRILSKYSSQWEVYSLGTVCSNYIVDGKVNPYIVTLRNSVTGEEAREYLPFYRESEKSPKIDSQ